MAEKIKFLKLRAKNLRRRIKQEKDAAKKLLHKSSRVRQRSGSAFRIGFFIDHLQELEAVIAYLEDRLDTTTFLLLQNGDKFDNTITGFLK